jgi:phosphonate degradation associated HDIG domain protein
MAMSVDEILRLYETRGARMYGAEPVSQTEHALQCAGLAAEGGASAELIAASFLHDIGHLIAELPHALERETDDVHQYLPIPFLRGTFADAVLEPIRLHVDAKRYLCKVERDYWDALSAASKHSLALQGGRFDALAAERFLARPFAWDAIRLRRWDDQAKVAGRATPGLRDFEPVLRSLERRAGELRDAGTRSPRAAAGA